MSDTRDIRTRRFATLWEVEEAEFEPSGNIAYLWESLKVDVPADARPYCCYICTVVFYDAEHNELARTEYRDWKGVSPTLLHVGGEWWECTGGQVMLRDGRWHMRHRLARNTRHAHMMNYGMKAFQNPEMAIGK